MRKSLLARASAGVFAFAGAVQAQEDAVVVTGTPRGSSLFELVAPASVLTGRELYLQRRSTLGETLEREPGVSASTFGPQVGRPVIRGLDADRIRILQNGVGTLDASSLSFDHAVPYDPLVAERVEVVRGPAAVLYGGNAVGGVVNVLDNRIPSAPITELTGRAEARLGGADRGRSLGGLVEGGNGSFAYHADGFVRRSEELRTPLGRLRNSDGQAEGGALGSALTWDRGYFGLSYGGYTSQYGSIPEPDVRIDMQSERWDLAGEVREVAPLIDAVKLKLGRTDYEHRELEAGAVNTTFLNEGYDGRLEVQHARIGRLQGALGLTGSKSDFSALGAEAFVPSTTTESRGLFLYEELPIAGWKLSFGARRERTEVDSQGGGNFGAPQSRSFTANSAAIGALYSLTRAITLAGNVSYTERAPTFYELYSGGPHAATGAFEVGDATLDKERSRSVDLGLRWRRAASSASVSVFRTRFNNYIGLFPTGDLRLEDGAAAIDADDDGLDDVTGEEVLPEFAYRAVRAQFTGLEARARLRVFEGGAGTADVLLGADYVRARNRESAEALPRIAPLRMSAGLEYARSRWVARAELLHADRQDRVAPNETPTDRYTLVNLGVSYALATQPVAVQLFARLDNVFDELARNHVSFIKDIAPLGGRALLVGARGSF